MAEAKEEEWLEELMKLNDEEDKKTDKQIKILEAAVEIFAEKGYAATSTSEIAQKAGVAEGTIFRHYKTKKDLLLSIVGPIMAKLVAPFFMREFSKIIETPYPRVEDFVRAIVRNRIEFARKNAKLLQIMAHEIPFQPELRAHVKENISVLVFEKIKKVVEHFQQEGQIIEAPPWRIMRFAASGVIGFAVVHLFLVPEFPIDEEEEIEQLIRLILYGITPRD